MVYGFCDPEIVFGVLENCELIIAKHQLEPFSDHVTTYATEVENGLAKRVMYGCTISLEEARSKKMTSDMEQVVKFADHYGFEKPSIMLGLSGDYDVRLRTYEPMVYSKKAEKDEEGHKTETVDETAKERMAYSKKAKKDEKGHKTETVDETAKAKKQRV